MTIGGERILRDALQLPPEDRAGLAKELLASLDGDAEPGAEAAWAMEFERRAHRVLSGESVAEDWTAVHSRIESKLTR